MTATRSTASWTRCWVAEDLLGDLPGLEQLLEVLALGRHLLLELLHAGVDVGLLDGHALLLGPVQHQLELDQALQRLPGRAVDVLGLLALLLGLLLLAELGLGHLAEAVGRDADAVDRRRVLVADAEVRAAGDEDGKAETQDGEQTAHGRPHVHDSTTTMHKHTGGRRRRGATMPR